MAAGMSPCALLCLPCGVNAAGVEPTVWVSMARCASIPAIVKQADLH